MNDKWSDNSWPECGFTILLIGERNRKWVSQKIQPANFLGIYKLLGKSQRISSEFINYRKWWSNLPRKFNMVKSVEQKWTKIKSMKWENRISVNTVYLLLNYTEVSENCQAPSGWAELAFKVWITLIRLCLINYYPWSRCNNSIKWGFILVWAEKR